MALKGRIYADRSDEGSEWVVPAEAA